MYDSKIKRKYFTDWLSVWRDKDIIKVVTGIRRCGKTTLFEIFRDKLLEEGVSPDQIISINFEEPDIPTFTQWRDVWEYIKPRMHPTLKTYLFMDEIQNVPEFERLVDGVYATKKFDVYITGSNSKFMSGELATFLTGRYVEIQLQPLFFAEYFAINPKTNPYEAFNSYISFGGFPFAALLPNDSRPQRDYLTGILDTILYKDVIARNGFRDAAILKRVTRFLFDNIGNLLSVNKIVGTFKNDGFTVPHATLDTYIEALCETFLLWRVNRYDVRGRQYLKTNAKYYIADTGLRRTLLGSKNEDRGRLLENIVYLELRRRYREVYVGVLGEKEIDFVAIQSGTPAYFQVALTALDESTSKRELAPLLALRDNYPKYLLTLDPLPPAEHNGIKCLNVLDFLLAANDNMDQ